VGFNIMEISARVSNLGSSHSVEVATDGRRQSIAIPAKTTGSGSAGLILRF
jgi:hypothetical protein